jgi:hypothetical protein
MLLLVIGPAVGSTAPLVTQPVRVTADDDNPNRLYSTPDVAVDPGNPLNVVVSFMDARTRRCGIMVSRNGGQTWTRPEPNPSPDSYPFCMHEEFDTRSNPIAFGRDGTLYEAFDGWDTSDGGWSKGNVSVFLGKSTDLGQSWETSTVRDARGKTGDDLESNGPLAWLAIDTHTGSTDKVYVGWNTAFPGHRLDQINRTPYTPFIAASMDGGKTFSAPFNLSNDAFANPQFRAEALAGTTPTTVGANPPPPPPPGSKAANPDQAGNFGGWGPSIAIDSKGTVYAVWTSTSSNLSPGPPAAHYVSKSTDNGKTWTHLRVSPISYAVYQFVTGAIAWTPDGGPEGTVHVVYDINPKPKVTSYGEVLYTQSRDGGKTWSDAKSLSGDAAATLQGQFYGNMSVAPNGRLDVAWWDQRNDPGNQGFDVYYSSSSDNGASWSKSLRVTAKTVSRTTGIWGFNYDMTSPPAIGSTNDYAMLAWDDTSLTDPKLVDSTNVGGGLQDVVTAAVQYKAVGGAGASSAQRAALAAIAGLLVAGAVLIVVARIRRAPWTESDTAGQPSTGQPVTR